MWLAAKRGDVTLVLSELALAEALVGPLRIGDSNAILAYEAIANETGFRPESVTWQVLRRAAEFRALKPSLRLPDAIHLATADLTRCAAFITNDKSLRNAFVNTIIVDDLI